MNKKSLQKLTVSKQKINALLDLPKMTLDDLKTLNKAECKSLMNILTKQLNEFKGVERDKFLEKIDGVIGEETRNEIWEHNHNKITWAISKLMQETGRMPTKSQLADETNLSRQTIYKHLKEYVTHPLFKGQMEQFKFMTSKVLAKVFSFAVEGDVKAAKLYLDLMRENKGTIQKNTFVQNQENYIQINGLILSQENIQQLNKEQLDQIITIIQGHISPR